MTHVLEPGGFRETPSWSYANYVSTVNARINAVNVVDQHSVLMENARSDVANVADQPSAHMGKPKTPVENAAEHPSAHTGG